MTKKMLFLVNLSKRECSKTMSDFSSFEGMFNVLYIYLYLLNNVMSLKRYLMVYHVARASYAIEYQNVFALPS